MEHALIWDMIMRDQLEYGIHPEWDRVVDLLELAILEEPVEEDESSDTGYEGDISSDEDVYDLDISLTMPQLEEFAENDSERVGQAELEVMDFGFFAGVTLEEMDELQKMDFD